MEKFNLDKEAKSVIDDMIIAETNGRTPMHLLSPSDARKSYLAMRSALSPPTPKVGIIKNFNIPAKKHHIPCRYYRGLKNLNSMHLPVMIFFHGGGWVIGDLDTHDTICRQLSNQGNFDVISIDYRLSPEHPFPAAIDDAFTAVNWIAKNGSNTFKILNNKIAVCGDSAGGNLATVTCLNSINYGPFLSCQILIYPSVDIGNKYNSHTKYEGLILSRKLMDYFENHYIQDKRLIPNNELWKLAPINSKNLSKFPPTFISVAECDPLSDEGIVYSNKLKNAGVEVKTEIFSGQIHGFLTMGARISAANKLINMISNYADKQFNKK